MGSVRLVNRGKQIARLAYFIVYTLLDVTGRTVEQKYLTIV